MQRLNADEIRLPAGKPTSLVILLHGVGANGMDLITLASAWREQLPDTVFVAPNAPQPYDGGYPDAYQWFSLEDITPENRLARVRESAPLLNDFMDEQLALYGLTDTQMALVGFSQGTIMALSVALKRARPCAGLLGYSGRLAGPESIEPVTAKPRTLLIHGTHDAVIPISELHAAEQALKAHGVPVVAVSESGVPHTISARGEELGGRFLQTCFSTDPDTTIERFAANAQAWLSDSPV